MNPELIRMEANRSLMVLRHNTYPGRGIVVGMNESGSHLIQVYWIMGRSANSRNRIFQSTDSGKLSTWPADSKKVEDPSLIIYDAMLEKLVVPHEGGKKIKIFAVSNGHQTKDIIIDGITSRRFVEKWQYEPDAPNFTPRINAMICWEKLFKVNEVKYRAEMSILTKDPFSKECNHSIYSFVHLEPGIGYCLTTYKGEPANESLPLPSFEGSPRPFLLQGSPEEILNETWRHLDPDNVVSLAVKGIDIDTGESHTGVINKYPLVEA